MKTNKILNYIKGSASLSEVRDVEEWIKASKENLEEFNRIKAEYIVSTFDETINTADTEKAFNIYTKNKSKKAISMPSFFKYAAILVLALGIPYFFLTNKQEAEFVPPKDAIVLELENGETKVIEEGASLLFSDAKGNAIGEQDGNTLKYTKESKVDKLVYNTLTVPYGKRFDILLSDNTKVTLNAGTSLRYPVKFLNGHKREVFINGEAFFDVAKDEKHPFVVNAKDVNVRVLGTKFNVSSYPEDLNAKTVLVEGSVSLYQQEKYVPEKATLLTPGHLATVNKAQKEISIEKVDVSLYTSWITGTVSFKHELFKNIAKKLERQFDVKIVCANSKLLDTYFTASFDNASIDYILETFKTNFGIQYTTTITNNKTTITIN